MTAREELAKKISDIFNALDFDTQVKQILQSYRVQMKRNRSKSDNRTAREELVFIVCDKRSKKDRFNIKDILDPFRIQSASKKYSSTRKKSPRKACEVVYIDAYKESLTPVSYGYVAGGPKRKGGSQKVCPKCRSMGLHLAKGYKERYYSCIYCGFHQELEAETYQY